MHNIIKTNKAAILCAIAAICCPLSNAQDIQVTPSIHPAGGFMNGGWGSINFEFTNTSDQDVTVKGIKGEWKVDGKSYNKVGSRMNIELAPNATGKGGFITYMPGESEELATAANADPYIEGTASLSNGESVSFKITVPVAKLATPLKAVTGEYMSVNLQESTWEGVQNPAKILRYLDEVYVWMQALTSNIPFNGDISEILECPPNPYFAYAGNPIVLNGAFAPASIKRFDNDLIDFGWVHEMGHNFDDVIGHWYNYGTYTEFQANIKLSYVIERMCTADSKIKIESKVSKQAVDGVTFNDEYFLPFGQRYIASGKPATEMASDDYHALFLTVIRQKGWDVMKKYYKTFVDLTKTGATPPEGYERIELTFAVLDHVSGMDLVPLYKEYRIPLEREDLDALIKKYNIK